MLSLRAVCIVLLSLSQGCSAASATLPIRVLASQPPAAPLPTPEPAALDAEATKGVVTISPRIGAPGGSGAGSRRVRPAQSGNETVGGLPAGSGAGTGAAGRG